MKDNYEFPVFSTSFCRLILLSFVSVSSYSNGILRVFDPLASSNPTLGKVCGAMKVGYTGVTFSQEMFEF
jgi:hypothetical protein